MCVYLCVCMVTVWMHRSMHLRAHKPDSHASPPGDVLQCRSAAGAAQSAQRRVASAASLVPPLPGAHVAQQPAYTVKGDFPECPPQALPLGDWPISRGEAQGKEVNAPPPPPPGYLERGVDGYGYCDNVTYYSIQPTEFIIFYNIVG